MSDSPDPVRARVHELLDELLDLVRSSAAPPAPSDGVLPLATAAARLGWTRRRLRAWCLARGIAVTGAGKHAAVDLGAVRRALAAQTPARDHRPVREDFENDLRAATGGR